MSRYNYRTRNPGRPTGPRTRPFLVAAFAIVLAGLLGAALGLWGPTVGSSDPTPRQSADTPVTCGDSDPGSCR